MPKLLEWSSTDDKRDVVHIIVQALVEGKLVVLPAETAYHVFASGLNESAIAQFDQLVADKKVLTPSVFLRSPQEALDYAPNMSIVAQRAVNRGWPGPLVLELPVDSDASLSSQLPESARTRLIRDGRFLGQRVAAHDAILNAMQLMSGPLVGAPIVRPASDGSDNSVVADGNTPVEAVCLGKEAGDWIGGAAALCVDDGQTHYGGLATAVRIESNECTIMTEGVIAASTLDQLFHLVVLLVCTGNTCRSPMAEVMLRDLLEKKFPDQMKSERPGAYIASAGLSAFPGGPASAEAQAVVKKKGLSLHSHQSRSVTERSLRHADFVLTMTRSHRAAIVERLPELAHKIELLSRSGHDVADPFGGTESVYAACADQIAGFLQEWVDELDDRWFPKWSSK